MLNRRDFMTYFGATGLSTTLLPGVLWAIAQEQQSITKEMIEQAEKVAGLELSAADRDAIAAGLSRNVRAYEQLRDVPLPNAVLPAVQFDAVLPGMVISSEQRDSGARPRGDRPIRYTRPPGVRRPDNLEEVAFWTVTRLAELVHTRQVMPSELTEMYLSRLKRHDRRLLTIVTLTEDRARGQAAQLDDELRRGRYRGPLHGIPWGAKDLLAVRGYPTTWGASPYREQTFDYDATVVEKLDAAGAVLIAKLAMGSLAQGDRWFGGMTRNPWNTEQGSSGSSAGPGAATAAGLVGFSIGTETLGSIVSPATRNGVTGLRPTFGRVSRHGAMALAWSMDKVGPMCRSAEDCALVLDAIRGTDDRDPTLRDVSFDWRADRPLSELRIGYNRAAFAQTTGEGERNRHDDAALEAMMRIVPDLIAVDIPVQQYPLGAINSAVLSVESAAAFDELTRSGAVDMMAPLPERSARPNTFRTARFVPAVEYINANRVRTLVMEAMHAAMRDIDVFITPGSSILLLTNLTGHPQVALPAGFTPEGTPVSISFVGRLFGEAELLRVAQAWQDATGHHLQYPPQFVG